MAISNSQLAIRMESLLQSWTRRERQYRDWIGGTPTGGPNGDGRYELTDGLGRTYLVACPALLADGLAGPAAAAQAALVAAEAARDQSLSEATRAEAERVLAEAAASTATKARDQAEAASARSQSAEANAQVHRQYAELAREGTAADLLGTTALHADTQYQAAWAENWAKEAKAHAEAAGNYDPSLYATRKDGLSQIVGLQDALNARLMASEFTWDRLPGKPTTYAPAAHSHAWAEITGKPSAFTPSPHSHAWGEITGKPATFNPSPHSHAWGEITGKPATFTPSPHSHAEYAAALHSHDWTQITGKPDLVTVADTNLGRTGNGGLHTFASFDDIGNLPTGWTSMIAPGAQGSPTGGYGYFMKVGRRDNSNGYSALWIDHGGRPDAFVGNASAGSQAPNWARLWTDKNFDPNTKASLAGGNAWNGVNRFRNSGEPGVQFLTDDEQTGMRFGPAGGISFKTNGVWQTPHGNIKDFMFGRVDQWNHSTDGYPRFWFAGQSRTYIRGYDGIEFRNAADVTTLFVREDGNLIGTGEVFAGIDRWFRVRGNTGIYWESHGGGWCMRDNTWMRSFNDKHVFTGGLMRADQGFYVGDLRQPVIRSGTAAPSGGSDGDLYVQF